MTENKRFELIIKGLKKGTRSGIWDNQKQHNMGIGDELWLGEVVAMLNEGVTLAEENKELKKENEQLKSMYSEQCIQLDFLKDENQHMRYLVNENKQLKDDVYDWKASAEDYLKIGKSLKKENEQLKIQLQNTSDQRDEFHRGARENANRVRVLAEENEELKQVLGSILIEVRRDISATNHSGEVKAFVNPNSFDLISDVLKKYGALNDWYE